MLGISGFFKGLQRLLTRQPSVAIALSAMLPLLRQWYETETGNSVLQAERPLIEAELSALFGYHLLEMTVSGNAAFAVNSPIHHRILVTPLQADAVSGAQLISAEASALPIACDVIDVVVLHHTLEYSTNPHHVLREVARVVIPRGHIVLVGYNPWSLLGLWRYGARMLSAEAHWQGHVLSLARMNDWLHLLNLTPIKIQRTYYRLPVGSRRVQAMFGWLDTVGRWLNLPFGGCYIITARKDIHAVTPMRPVWGLPVVRKRQVALALVPSAHRVREPSKS